MNQEQAKQLLPIITAFSEGKTIQIKIPHNWIDLDDPDWTSSSANYRIKPTSPTYRAWKQEEVPVGCLIKPEADLQLPFDKAMITGVSKYRANTSYPSCNFCFETLFNSFEHSTDGGKTWSPCGVLE